MEKKEKLIKRINIIGLLIFLICIIYLLFELITNMGKTEIKIGNDNSKKVYSMISADYQNIKKIQMKQGLGDVYLYLYNDKGEIKETIEKDESDIANYIRKKGTSSIFNVIVELIIVIVIYLIFKEGLNLFIKEKLSK